MSRKVDSSAGGGLKGGSMGDADGALLDVVGLAGGFPELFLVLGIVTTTVQTCFLRCKDGLDSNCKRKPSTRHPPRSKNTRALNAPLQHHPNNHIHALKLMEDRKPKERSGLIARAIVRLSPTLPKNNN